MLQCRKNPHLNSWKGNTTIILHFYIFTYVFPFTLIFEVFLLQQFSQNFLNPCFCDSSKWYLTWKFSGNIITQQAVAGDHTQKIFFAETICIASSLLMSSILYRHPCRHLPQNRLLLLLTRPQITEICQSCSEVIFFTLDQVFEVLLVILSHNKS